MIAETLSHIFRWRSRFRCRRICLSSLVRRMLNFNKRPKRPHFDSPLWLNFKLRWGIQTIKVTKCLSKSTPQEDKNRNLVPTWEIITQTQMQTLQLKQGFNAVT